MFSFFVWLVTFLCIVIGSLIIYARWNYGTLEKLGIPVMKPYLFFGSNYMDPYVVAKYEEMRRFKKYGHIYGVYDGRTPQIYISDPKYIRQICTVDFDHFRNHDRMFSTNPNSLFFHILDSLNDDMWKTIRKALSPMVSLNKLKQLEPMVDELCNTRIDIIQRKSMSKDGKIYKFEAREFVAPLVIEVLAKYFCGIEVPNNEEGENEFINKMKITLTHDINKNRETWTSNIPKIFPFLSRLIPPQFSSVGDSFFIEAVKHAIKLRKQQTGDSGVSNTCIDILIGLFDKVKTDPIYKSLGITDITIFAQPFEFFVAGYLSVIDVMGALVYELGVNPNIQDRIYNEIQNERSEEDGYPYLSAVIQETLRVHLGFSKSERVCNKTWSYEGLKIPKGMQIIFPMYAVHRNPEIYYNPDTFIPERFLGKEKEKLDPNTFVTFGIGPRDCIGRKYAAELIKFTFITFIKRFIILKRDDTKIQTHPGGQFLITVEPILVDLQKRF